MDCYLLAILRGVDKEVSDVAGGFAEGGGMAKSVRSYSNSEWGERELYRKGFDRGIYTQRVKNKI